MVRASERRLARMMRSKGFNLEIENRDDISPESIDKLGTDLAQYNPYDMIVFDHDLGDRKGTDLAQQLRGKIFTDMVYYSAAPIDELRKAIYDAKVDGVFLINKQSCADDLMRILEDHIKKNCDLNSMRGIVLDAISEIEVALRRDLIYVLKNDSGALRASRRKSLQSRLRKKGKELKDDAETMTQLAVSMDDAQLLECFADPIMSDFNTIRQMLYACKNDWECLSEEGLLHKLQSLRNVFAHESYKFDQDNNCVLVRVKGKEQRFNADIFESIRKELLEIMDEIRNHCN